MNQKSGMFLWKFFGFFAVSYLILSIPINNKALFDYGYDVTSPATKPVYSAIKIGFVEGWEATRKFSKKLFSNSAPTETAYIDSVEHKLAGPEREPQTTTQEAQTEEQEIYTDEERALVEKSLENP